MDRIGITEDPEDGLVEEEIVERVRELPPSAKLVYRVLKIEDGDEPLSYDEISEHSLLSDRTTSYALSRLDEEGVITDRRDIRDPRSKTYELNTRD
ncbi:MAG: winged helix-turn-helix transcriptional regulator [Candidatus Aenigmatarchaeota archaeon]